MFLFPDSGPKKGLSAVSLKTVTPHLRSIVPNVQRHMVYFASYNIITPCGYQVASAV
jgi:hypothetical protein